MGTLSDAQFANQLGHFYQGVARQIGDYIHQHIDTLSESETDTLSGDQTKIIDYANTFFSLSDKIAFENSDEYFSKVTEATGQITDALNTITEINQMITITAGIITLAASIVTGSGGGVVSSLASIIGAIRTIVNEEASADQKVSVSQKAAISQKAAAPRTRRKKD